jgi:hypothetical protein
MQNPDRKPARPVGGAIGRDYVVLDYWMPCFILERIKALIADHVIARPVSHLVPLNTAS